jgi:hypothetical protein
LWLRPASLDMDYFIFFVHPVLVTNPGMPVWWTGFCGTIDLVLGGRFGICLWTTR